MTKAEKKELRKLVVQWKIIKADTERDMNQETPGSPESSELFGQCEVYEHCCGMLMKLINSFDVTG